MNEQLRQDAAQRPPLRVDILTIFPHIFEPTLSQSVTGRARDAGLIAWKAWDIRAFSRDKHQKVDDRPFGGGPGMVMQCQPVWDAAQAALADDAQPARRLFLTPEGRPLTQRLVEELARQSRLLLLCGRYEGVDERVVEALEMERVSVGDFVVSGGEIPAMLLIDAVARLLPGALGCGDSAREDSFSPAAAELAAGEASEHPPTARLLDCPHYTRPRLWMGREVPEVLLSGDHQAVARWRLAQRLARTRTLRPDLLAPGAEEGADSHGST